MPTHPSPVDTRGMFRPVSHALIALLRSLSEDDWRQPTIAGTWVVRDVVAHLIDLSLRRLSFHRDGMSPPPPPRPIQSEADFVAFINDINAAWVSAAQRLSPAVLTDLCERAGRELAAWFESQPLEGPALFGVSWAGEQASENWFDIGREFTELWHHQQQIRLAVQAPTLEDPAYLRAVLALALRGLPHAYRNVAADTGTTVGVDITGPSGGQWTLQREDSRWVLLQGRTEASATSVSVADDAAWRLLFNALKPADADAAVTVSGRHDLASPLLRARAVIV